MLHFEAWGFETEPSHRALGRKHCCLQVATFGEGASIVCGPLPGNSQPRDFYTLVRILINIHLLLLLGPNLQHMIWNVSLPVFRLTVSQEHYRDHCRNVSCHPGGEPASVGGGTPRSHGTFGEWNGLVYLTFLKQKATTPEKLAFSPTTLLHRDIRVQPFIWEMVRPAHNPRPMCS